MRFSHWRWSPPKPRCIIVIWLAVLGLCCLAGRNLHLEGDMRELALMPEDLRSNEQEFKQIWGDVRGQAMVFAGGATFQKALEANQAVYDQLMLLLSKNAEPNADQNGVLSLAPLLPPESLQRRKAQRVALAVGAAVAPLRTLAAASGPGPGVFARRL